MKNTIKTAANAILMTLILALGIGMIMQPTTVSASGGSGSGGGGGGTGVDTIKVSKCYYMLGATSMLMQASSSDTSARLFAYLPDGTYLGEIQNGGGGRYGGTVLLAPRYDPGYVIVKSSSGGITTAPTTPFQI